MSPLLETLEWLGTALAVLLGVAVLAAGRGEGDAKGAAIPRGLGLVLAIAGIGIVVFATIAAMGG